MRRTQLARSEPGAQRAPPSMAPAGNTLLSDSDETGGSGRASGWISSQPRLPAQGTDRSEARNSQYVESSSTHSLRQGRGPMQNNGNRRPTQCVSWCGYEKTAILGDAIRPLVSRLEETGLK